MILLDVMASTTVVSIASLFSTIGFPSAICCVLLYLLYRQDVMHKEDIEKLTEAINGNTLALTRLIDRGGINERLL